MSQQVQRAVRVLNALSVAGTGGSIRELAQACDLPKSAVQRLLASLLETGLVVQHPGSRRYGLGPRTLAWGMAYRAGIDLRALASEPMTRLRDETGETIGLTVPLEDEVMHVEQVESNSPLRRTFEIGRPLPLWCGAPSRLVLAERPDDEVRRLARQRDGAGIVPAAAPEVEVLVAAVTRCRAEGYAVACGETIAGVNTIAVPVRGAGGRLEAAISATGPSNRWDEAAMLAHLDLLLEAGRQVGLRLGQ